MSGTHRHHLAGWRQEDPDRGAPASGRARAALGHPEPLRLRRSTGRQKIPLVQVSDIEQQHGRPRRIVRLDQFRTMTVYCFPAAGHPAVGDHQGRAAQARANLQKTMPPGYTHHHRRRVRQAAGRLPQSGDGAGDLDLRHLPGAALPVQQRGQAAAGLRRRALRRRRRDRRRCGS